MRIGITGHQRLAKRLTEQRAPQSEDAAWDWVEDAFARYLDDLGSHDLVIISSLAGGADQRLARVGVRHGAQLEVIVPAAGYINALEREEERKGFVELLSRAAAVETLAFGEPSEAAFFAAGKRMVELSDAVVAVWDGRPAEGLGGTGDVVAYAMEHGRRVIHLDPVRRHVTHRAGSE